MSVKNKYAHVNKSRGSAALRGAFWSAINSIAPVILNSLVFILSSRYLAPNEFGVLAIAISVVSLASAFAPAAFGEALIQKVEINNKHLDAVFWLCFGSAIILYSLLFILSPFIANYVGGDKIILDFILILGVKLFFDLPIAVPNALIARAMTFQVIASRTIIATVISGSICIGLLIYGYGIWALVAAQIASSVTSLIATFIGAKWLPGFTFSRKELRELSRYGLFASANRFLQVMNIDQIVIGMLIGPTSLGIFNFAKRLFQMINDVIAGALTSVTHTLLSSLQHEEEKVREAFLMATFGSSIISFPAFLGLAAVVSDAIPLIFGAQWVDAIWPTRWFCIIGLMSCIGVIQSSLINSQGKSDWWFYYQLMRQIITISTIYILRNNGISEIVLAIALQTIVLWPITLFMVSKIIKIKVGAYFYQFFAPLISSIVMMASVLLLAYDFKTDAYNIHLVNISFQLVSEILLGVVIYTLSLILFSKARLMRILKSLIGKKFNKFKE